MSKRIIFIFFVFFLLSFILPIKALASDLTVICTSSSCSAGGASLFNETNIAPGYSVTKSILIDNTLNFDNCNLGMIVIRQGEKGDPDLAQQIITLIKAEDNSVYFGDSSGSDSKNFNDLFGQTISLGVVNKNSTRSYSWLSTFESTSGNDYQATAVTFDFNLNFVCGTPFVPTAIPLQNQNNNQDQGGNGVGDIGLETTFSPTPLILGATDNQIIPTLSPNQNTDNGSILGLECENPVTFWWLILLIQAVLSFIVLILRSTRIPLVGTLLVMVLFGLISQLLHNLWGCSCLEDSWCGRYFYLNLGIILISTLGSFIASRRTLKQ